jgi:hypothetical protein
VWAAGSNKANETIGQSVRVPANGKLTYWWQLTSSEATNRAYDYMRVHVYDAITGTHLATPLTRSNTSARDVWTNDTVSLSAYAGRDVRIVFAFSTDSSQVSRTIASDWMRSSPPAPVRRLPGTSGKRLVRSLPRARSSSRSERLGWGALGGVPVEDDVEPGGQRCARVVVVELVEDVAERVADGGVGGRIAVVWAQPEPDALEEAPPQLGDRLGVAGADLGHELVGVGVLVRGADGLQALDEAQVAGLAAQLGGQRTHDVARHDGRPPVAAAGLVRGGLVAVRRPPLDQHGDPGVVGEVLTQGPQERVGSLARNQAEEKCPLCHLPK